MRLPADDYITHRIIDACLRENLFNIVRSENIAMCLPAGAPGWHGPAGGHWLAVEVQDGTLYLPIKKSRYMQAWQAVASSWLFVSKAGWCIESGYRAWLSRLAADKDEATQNAFNEYCLEAETAVTHRQLCDLAYQQFSGSLSQPISTLNSWQEKMLFSDQIAAYLDHPYYPTARAKFGFDDEALRNFAPEYAPQFLLCWVAVNKTLATVIAETPACWPSFGEVGLAAEMAHSHVLFPVHPLTWLSWDETGQDVIKAPGRAMMVTPTLSVRTVAVVANPDIHIKVPLLMKTLGARNVRLIKPSTLYDGHWFGELLTLLEQREPEFKNRYRHCNEQHAAHVGESPLQAYIVRRYPSSTSNQNAPVPVAALAAEMPDGRLYLQHLIDEYYQGDVTAWVDQYLDLMLAVHLRLWLQYGIALEANQQNSMVVFNHNQPLTLIMKDNDSARLLSSRLVTEIPDMAVRIGEIKDARILVDDELSLGQMFCTIILQLNIAAIIEAMSGANMVTSELLYGQLRHQLRIQLKKLQSEGISTAAAEHILYADKLYAKYLLSAGSLMSKQQSGAADINKYYGLSVPNFLRD